MSTDRTMRRRVAIVAFCCLAAPAAVHAQGFQFAPAIAVLASVTDNPLLTSGQGLGTNSLLVEAQLPFQFRGPRWNGSFIIQPGYQKYRDSSARDSYTGAMQVAVEGRLSPRASLFVQGELLRSNDLLGQLGVDIVLPRQTQTRGHGEVRLDLRMTPRDSLSIAADYQQLDYAGGAFVGHRAYGIGVGYGRAVASRLTLTATARGQQVRFDTGVDARSLATTAGFAYRLGPHTEFAAEGGVLWIQQDAGSGFADLEGPGWTAIVSLTHSLRAVALGVTAWRDMGFTNGLGRTTLRDQLLATVSTGQRAWNLTGTVGYARNRQLLGSSSSGPSVDSWTGCVGAGVRLTSHLAAVGSFLFAHQIGAGTPSLDIDSYRAAAGIMLRLPGPNAPLRPGQRLDARSMARSAHVTC